MKPFWIGPALKAAFHAFVETYKDAKAAGELNDEFYSGTGHPIGDYSLEEGRRYRNSQFRNARDFILFWSDSPSELNFDPATPAEAR